jgi:hypothetical protein
MQPMPHRWQGWGHSQKVGWIFGSLDLSSSAGTSVVTGSPKAELEG